jgi:hypothetical protein
MALYSQTAGPFNLASSVSATSSALVPSGAVVGFVEPRQDTSVGQAYTTFTTQLVTSGTVSTISYQLLGSLDGKNWAAIGSASTTTTNGTLVTWNTSGVYVPYVAISVNTLTGGGSVSVNMVAAA